MMQDEDLGGSTRRNVVSQGITRISQIYQRYLDLWTPHAISRWLFALFLLGWYIVTYALGIYHLNLFIAFLTPKIDPAMDFDDGEGPELPTRSNEEFRPFIRRLPEFKFWYSVTKSTIVAMICTLFDCFNIPVFWPILVMYFITLFCITMKRQIKHAYPKNVQNVSRRYLWVIRNLQDVLLMSFGHRMLYGDSHWAKSGLADILENSFVKSEIQEPFFG
ncbi:Protein RER1 [Camponotus floridanus]|uniref:Protein RER1 n=1 Tax=Camponotus floridanus TaxID=104421 RepID=E2B0Y6_CAMFO|nr:Protein RER1 [Camponotus floridanus]